MENKYVKQMERIIKEQDLIGLANLILSIHIPGPGITKTKQKFRNKVLESKFLPTLLNLLTNTYLANGGMNCLCIEVYVNNFIKLFIYEESEKTDNNPIFDAWKNVVSKPILGQPVENFSELCKWRMGQPNNAPNFEPPKHVAVDEPICCKTDDPKGDCDGDNEKVKFVGVIHHVATDKAYKPKLKIKDGVITKAWYDNVPQDLNKVEYHIRNNFQNLMNSVNSYKLVAKCEHLTEFGKTSPHIVTSYEFGKQRFDVNFETFMTKLKTSPEFIAYHIMTLELNVVKHPKQKRYLKK